MRVAAAVKGLTADAKTDPDTPCALSNQRMASAQMS